MANLTLISLLPSETVAIYRLWLIVKPDDMVPFADSKI